VEYRLPLVREEALIAYYKFDDVGGTEASNEIEGGPSAKLENGLIFENAGKFGRALSFSDGDDRLDIEGGLPLPSDWTLAVWFKELFSNTEVRGLFRGSLESHALVPKSGDDLGIFISGSTGFIDSTVDLPSANYLDWHHITVVGTGGKTIFYIDGVKTGFTNGQSNDALKHIGNTNSSSSWDRFARFLDDLRVYRTALTAEEVTAIYGSGVGDSDRTPSIPGGLALTVEKGKPINFKVPVPDASSITATGLPGDLSLDAATGIISGSTDVTGTVNVEVNATNLNGSSIGNLALRMVDFDAYSAKMEIRFPGTTESGLPRDLPGLVLWLDAESVQGVIGDRVTVWGDSSGNENNLDKVRGRPVIAGHESQEGQRVVRFDGYSQLHSTTDFGPMLSEYSVLTVARYLGGDDERIISTIGSNWAFGLGNGNTGHWTAGTTVIDSAAQSDTNWHLHSGTMTSGALATLRRDGYTLATDKTGADPTAYKPALFALGGSNANERFGKGEVAEIMIFDRVLTATEIESMESYLRDKWFGGSTKDFPLLVRLGPGPVAGFDYSTFADQTTAGDLRFFDSSLRELPHELETWDIAGESIAWVKLNDIVPGEIVTAYWGNDSDKVAPAYRADGSTWSNFEGVWHLSQTSADPVVASATGNRNGSRNGGVTSGDSSAIGWGYLFDGLDDSITISGYSGILGSSPRTISAWVKTSGNTGDIAGWGGSGNHWQFGIGSGTLQLAAGTGISNGTTSVNDDEWHHLAVTFPTGSSDSNQSILYFDGKQEPAGNSATGTVSTASVGDVTFGYGVQDPSRFNGKMDEIRISGVERGSRWIRYSAENQKLGSTFVSTLTEYLIAPQLPSELNASVALNIPFIYAIPASPPASEYNATGLPSWASLNVATGEISGTPDATSVFSATVTATNAKGSTTVTLNLISTTTPSTASLSALGTENVEGRSATLLGDMNSTGGDAPGVTVFYGTSDGGATSSAWDANKSLGSINQGLFNAKLTNIDSGETYFFRFQAVNNSGTSWSESLSFTTKRFDQGTIRIHTGDNETGLNSGFYWDKSAGESKILDANSTLTTTYVAPDGSAWPVTVTTFHFPENLYLGTNLSQIILSGKNSLSLQIDGNATIEKSFSGATPLANPVVLGATKIDGHDGYYGDDTTRSNRIGLSVLGGYGGNQGPGRGYKTWLTGGGASHAGEGGQGDRGPGGLSYGSGALDFLLGGSGGGGGNGGESGGGGGAMEIVASGDVTIAAGVTIKMNGGTIFVNPNQGAYRTGGAGSGGGIRIEASNIRNLGILEALGGDAAGQDERETGQRYRQSVGGGGGGGRVAIISDGTIVKGSINVNGGKGMAEGLPGLPGSVYVGSKSQVAGDLIFNSGTLTIDTGGSWSHSSGTKGAGVVTHHSFKDNGGARFGYGICTFSFDSVNLGPGVAVVVRGRNAIQLKVAGNVLINTAISLDGSSGSQGAYSGRAGPGGWNSGRAADNVISNEHLALEGQGPGGGHGFETGRSNGGGSYGGQGTGGLFGGTPGS
ncbi:MAG: putative Ig domain-containing protein, partial [Verrucomicrobia bacterium]|nr:putative Ig domain-containing protein [Verrucomicrobiota bacterium]